MLRNASVLSTIESAALRVGADTIARGAQQLRMARAGFYNTPSVGAVDRLARYLNPSNATKLQKASTWANPSSFTYMAQSKTPPSISSSPFNFIKNLRAQGYKVATQESTLPGTTTTLGPKFADISSKSRFVIPFDEI